MKTFIPNHNEQLFYCEACDGYALVVSGNGKVIVTPCGCDN